MKLALDLLKQTAASQAMTASGSERALPSLLLHAGLPTSMLSRLRLRGWRREPKL
jgi:hypothetical protein